MLIFSVICADDSKNGEDDVFFVLFCLENEKNYNLARENFNVSYQQIYSWVRKYELGGVEMLADNRGRMRLDADLTEEERLRRENTKLRARIRELKARIAELEGVPFVDDGAN